MSIEAIGEGGDNFLILADQTFSEAISDTLKNCASYLMMPFWEAETAFQYCLLPHHPGEYGQEINKTHEFVKRFFIALFAAPVMVLTLPMALSSFALTGIARIFESKNYSNLKGKAQEVQVEKPKFMHLNFCGLYGGLPYSCGGTTPANARVTQLVETVHEIDPDLLFLCECNRMLTPALYYSLREDYSHFFVDIGLNSWGMEACQFVASRVPILSPPSFHAYYGEVKGEEMHMMRGFFALETTDKWYIYTHLHSGNGENDREIRQRELIAIQRFIDEKTGDKPCVLLGDLNINRMENPNNDYQQMIAHGYKDYFLDQHPDAVTGSDALDYHIKNIEKQAPLEVLDYILINGKGKEVALQIDVLETYKTKLDESLSDHKGLIGV